MKLITPKYNKIKSIVTIISRVSKRTMHTTRNIANKGVNMNLIRSGNQVGINGTNTQTVVNPHTLQPRGDQKNMATLVAYKFKGNAAKDFANDGSGKHAHICKETCVQQDCAKKKCTYLCDTLVDRNTLGHNTHKPIAGRFSKFISDIDANGNPDPQYFTKTNKESITDAATLNKYKSDKFSVDPAQTAFVNSTDDIRDKYEGQ